MASEPMSLERLRDIPDPAAGVDATPVPAATPPAEASLTRAARARRVVASIALATAWLLAVLFVVGFRPDLATPLVAMPIAAWLAVGAVLLGVVLRPRARGLPAGIRVVQHAVWIVPAIYVAVAVIVAAPSGLPLEWGTIRGCAAMSTSIALGSAVAAAIVLRGSFFSAAGWRGAAVGALAGLAGSVGAHAHCPVPDLGHLLAAHGAPIVLFALAGAVVGRLGGRP